MTIEQLIEKLLGINIIDDCNITITLTKPYNSIKTVYSVAIEDDEYNYGASDKYTHLENAINEAFDDYIIDITGGSK